MINVVPLKIAAKISNDLLNYQVIEEPCDGNDHKQSNFRDDGNNNQRGFSRPHINNIGVDTQ